MIPGNINTDLISGADEVGYQVTRSLRFNSADSAYLSRTPASAGNRKKWTWAGWVKLNNSSSNFFWGAGPTSGQTNYNYARFGVFNDKIQFLTAGQYIFTSTAVYRDYSAWGHITLVCDTTQAVAADRLKVYYNSVAVTNSAPATLDLNGDYAFNAAEFHAIGSESRFGSWSGYLADVHFIDGQALTPSSFTEVSATTGQLIPKAYTGTFTGNSFWLKFADNSAATATTLGKDSSGLGNNWTPNNLSVSDPTIATAGGGLPLYNTSGNYGDTQVSGLRSDANASYLSLATALGTGSGLDLVDQNIAGRTSSIKTITNAGAVTTSTANQFYGGSARFTGATNSRASVASSSDFAFGFGDFTIEFWVKSEAANVNPTFYRRFFTTGPDSVNSVQLGHIISTSGNVVYYTSSTVLSSTTNILNTWCHVALTRSSGTVRLFINGVLEASGTDTNDKSNSSPSIGNYNNTNDGRMQGEMQDLRVYKGIAKYTASFVVPSRSLAANNDSLVDTPTSYGTDTGAGGEVRGNYCTWNPLACQSLGAVSLATQISDGNLFKGNGTDAYGWVPGTVAFNSGKFYWEITVGGSPDSNDWLGIIGANESTATGGAGMQKPTAYLMGQASQKVNNNSYASYGTGFAAGDIVGVACDFSGATGSITFYKNGVSQGAAYTTIPLTTSYTPVYVDWSNAATGTFYLNAGQRPFAYTAPSGFKALCDTNLPAPTIAKPSTVMDVKLYTGNGSTQTISGLGFSPDFVWIKGRGAAVAHQLFDQVRGVTRPLDSSYTYAENGPSSYGLTAFNSDGFSLNDIASGGYAVNGSPGGTYSGASAAYVAWAWDAGSSTVTNTQGSITSQVRANASAGFSIVAYTGNGSAGTVGHGLNAAPSMIILKNRDTTANWLVYHSSRRDGYNPQQNMLYLNSTGVGGTGNTYPWNNTAPTSTVFSIGGGDYGQITNGSKIVAYCFAPVNSYSAFGSYQGNGATGWPNADGPFVYTGFRPRFILIKRTDASGNWLILDAARLGYNAGNSELQANLSAAEGTYNYCDILSNGFKLRGNDASGNASGSTYVWAAFAESPFAYSRAR